MLCIYTGLYDLLCKLGKYTTRFWNIIHIYLEILLNICGFKSFCKVYRINVKKLVYCSHD